MAGPMEEEFVDVGPTLDDDVSVSDRYQGFRESKWWETVKENLDEEQGPSFAVSPDEGWKRIDAARGYDVVRPLNSSDSS